jgi:hypothetical protein
MTRNCHTYLDYKTIETAQMGFESSLCSDSNDEKTEIFQENVPISLVLRKKCSGAIHDVRVLAFSDPFLGLDHFQD